MLDRIRDICRYASGVLVEPPRLRCPLDQIVVERLANEPFRARIVAGPRLTRRRAMVFRWHSGPARRDIRYEKNAPKGAAGDAVTLEHVLALEKSTIKRERQRGSAESNRRGPYGAPDIELGHHGKRCSFDAFLDKRQMDVPALLKLVEIVRGTDLFKTVVRS